MTLTLTRLRWILASLACCLALLAGQASAQQAESKENAVETYETEFISLKLEGNRVTSLRFDGTGQGQFGAETIAPGGAIKGVKAVVAVRHFLLLTPESDTLEWEIPYVRSGFYDADAHLNYPDPRTTAGAVPLVIPFRSFTGSSGNVVRIEHFKNIDPETGIFLWINIADGNRLLMQSDHLENWDLDTNWPGPDRLNYRVEPDRLVLIGKGIRGDLQMEVARRGSRDMPRGPIKLPSASFEPDFQSTYAPTGKSISASQLMTEFLRHGIYWCPTITIRGEWALANVENHIHNDPRSYYTKRLRYELLYFLQFVGYDRFEHFGHLYMWGFYPDYGAGMWLNTPPGNAPFDKRILQNNPMWVQALTQYVLATRDFDFLNARRARWVMTDGGEPQPIVGGAAKEGDVVLAPGDMRLDGRAAQLKHSLGQEFTAEASFRRVGARLGNPSGWVTLHEDLQGASPLTKETNAGKLTLYSERGGRRLGQAVVAIEPGKTEDVWVDLGFELPAGKYYLELTDDASGQRYFSPGITWMTELESDYAGGDAWSGPMRCRVSDTIQTLFDYTYKVMGADKTDLAHYQDDPDFNIPDQKSGRNRVGMAASYWENAGNAHDSYIGLWYNAACSAMAELAALKGDAPAEARYRELRARADQAFNDYYWFAPLENGNTWERYFSVRDWDGVIHDFGYTYNNLEIAARGIAPLERMRKILWWLDRGEYSPDGGTTWVKDMYALWEIAPPFNTVENLDYLPISGTLPYLQVLTNGGTRPDVTARDLKTRTEALSIDNMHERNARVLNRYASPDRLTGGRTNTTHWIGRWQFLGPDPDILDFEGFRDIFPQNGVIASLQPDIYLGFGYEAGGLRLRPQVPSVLDSYSFDSIGYGGGVWNFKARALRDEVSIASSSGAGESVEFQASGTFNKVGVQATVSAAAQPIDNVQASLTLERRTADGWTTVTQTWMNHVQPDQWLWVDARAKLAAGETYRLRLHDLGTPDGTTLGFARGAEGTLTLRAQAERTELSATPVYLSQAAAWTLGEQKSGIAAGPAALHETLTAVLDPGQSIWLKPVAQP